MKQEQIKIYYPGDCISVNHYLGKRKGGGFYVKPETKEWIVEFQWLLKRCHIEDCSLPLEITCSGYFKDARSAPDLSNLSKVVLDAIQEPTGLNDKDFRWHDGKREIGYKDPYLLITITGDTQEMSLDAPQSKSSGVKERSNSKPLSRRKRAIKKR